MQLPCYRQNVLTVVVVVIKSHDSVYWRLILSFGEDRLQYVHSVVSHSSHNNLITVWTFQMHQHGINENTFKSLLNHSASSINICKFLHFLKKFCMRQFTVYERPAEKKATILPYFESFLFSARKKWIRRYSTILFFVKEMRYFPLKARVWVGSYSALDLRDKE